MKNLNSESIVNYLIKHFSKNQEIQLKNLIDNKQSKKICETLFKTGHAVEPNEAILELRTKIGLPRIPPMILSSEKELNRFQQFLKKMKLYNVK